MSELDPDSDRVDATRATYAPGGATEVRRISRRPNNTVLWALAVIGAVTIAAAAFIMVSQNDGVTGQQLSTVAAEQGRAQALSDGAVAAQQSALAAQQSADQSIARSQQIGADQAAHDRAAAEDAASRAAASADQAGHAASTVRPASAGDAAPQQ